MKFGLIKNLISQDIADQAVDILEDFKDHSTWLSKWQCYELDHCYNKMHMYILPKLEKIVGEELLPGHNFGRIYYEGSPGLRKHIDQDRCEYGITLNLKNEIDPWAFWTRDDWTKNRDIDTPFYLNPGEGVWYRGREVLHWREANPTKTVHQAFFFFVAKHGEFSKWGYNESDKDLWEENLNNPLYHIDF